MTGEKIKINLGKIELFIQLFQAVYAFQIGKKPDEKSQLRVLEINCQDGLTIRIIKTEPSNAALEKPTEN